MAYFPYTVTEGNITILINGSLHKIPRTHAGFAALSEHLKGSKHDSHLIIQLLDKRSAMARLTSGKVKVVGTTVYYSGVPLHSSLATKLVTMMDEGYDGEPLARFLDNIMLNPSERSRECLFDFISKFDAPITEDGCFVAFKGVRDDYGSCHANKDGSRMDNSPGKTVTMPREECVEDPTLTCEAGLHVCASHYLDSFWTNSRVMAVKVNPRDVVSVPHDYNYSKMRVCEYLVLGDIEDERHRERIENATMVHAAPDENRVEASKPSSAKGYIPPKGYTVLNRMPCEDDYVIKPGSTEIGLVDTCRELYLDDLDHPDNSDWVSGDIARNDAGNYNIWYVYFNGVIETFVVEDYEEVNLRVVVEDAHYYCSECGVVVDFEGEICDICETLIFEEEEEATGLEDGTPEESLIFFHEATGQVFTAAQVLEGIAEHKGQRGMSRATGVPRTTIQEWIKAID